MRMAFLGSMMKTLRMVKAMPFSSTLVASWWSILESRGQFAPGFETKALCALCYSHVVLKGNLPLLVADDGELELGAADLIDVLDPAAMALDRVGAEPDELDAALCELGFQLGERAELGGAAARKSATRVE